MEENLDILKIDKVNKKYPSFELKDVSFSVPKGSIVGFIGRNGAGKTTTLKGIMNLLSFDSGTVYYDGKNIRDYELEAKQEIGFSLSELNYYPDKKVGDLNKVTSRFYKNYSKENYQKLCEMFSLDENKRLQELSSGMKVKFSLATALSHNAKLLILDEPTSGLDPISRDEILDIFISIIKNKERSILFSTHITSDLDKCATHIAYIKKGEIQYFGKKDAFVSSYNVIEGKLTDLTKYEEILISHKVYGDTFIGLIHADELDKVDTKSIKVKTPDLEEVMIYLERDKENEEFNF